MEGRLTPGATLAPPVEESAAGYPLSPQQRRVWSFQRDDPHAGYSVACAVEIEGALDDRVLTAALREVIDRHEILRVRFRRLPALAFPVQVVAPESMPQQLPRLDLSHLAEGEQRCRIAGLLADLACGERSPDDPPLTVRRLDRGRGRGTLLLALPALCADFATLDHLAGEIARACAATPGSTSGLQYPDVAELFRQLEMEPGGDPPAPPAEDLLALRLPGEREGGSGFAPRALRTELEPDLLAALETVARETGLPLSILLLAGWQWLLGCRTGGDRALAGVAFDGRIYEGMERALGPYTRCLPVSSRLDGGRRFLDLAAELGRAVEELAAIQDWLTPELALGQPGGAPVRFLPFGFRFEAPAAELRLWCREGASERFHLELACRHAQGALTIELRHDSARFPAAEAGRLMSQLLTLCREVSRAPQARLGELTLSSAAECHQLRVEINDTAADYGEPRLLHALFEEQTARTPGAVALSCDGESLTYAELDARADRLAGHLAGLGVGPDSPVAIHLERSPALVVAILAALKAGGAYLPLDPDYPAPRLERMLAASGATVLLTERRLAGRLATPVPRRVELLDAVEPELALRPGRRAPCRATPDHLAYLLFTSGSTGAPKGVMVTHRAIVNHMRWMQEVFPLTADDRVLQKTPASFDASVWELFAPLFAGARLVLARPGGHREPAYLVAALGEQRVTILQVVPTLLRLLLAEPGFAESPGLRRVFCGGEALAPDLQERFAAVMRAELVNVYGPTEATIHATSWTARGPVGEVVPIGGPVANARVYLAGESGDPVPAGAPGELWVGGAGLARGYLGDPAQTAARFVPDPWSGEPGSRLYRTGDRVRLGAVGEHEFLGRLDDQVKLRGFRIEPGEIEATLRQSPAVRDAAVVVRGAGEEIHLAAYVVPAGPAGTVADLGDFLRARLPEPMVPSQLVLLDALPLTPSGKVDRGALPAGGERPVSTSRYVAPRDPREERVAALWAEVLGAERIGIEDDFFALGGHSLLAIRLVARLRAELRIELPLGRLFAAPTVAGLAAASEGAPSTAVAVAAVPDPARAGEPFPLTRVQQAYWIGRRPGLELGGVGSHEYLEVAVADLDAGRLGAAWRRLVDRHGMLRAVTDADGRQRILPYVEPYQVRVFDLRGLDGPAAEQALAAVRYDLSHQLFATEVWPLFALGLSLLPSGKGRLHVSLDLLICDARSLQVLARELVQLYADPVSPLPPLALSFRDYVLAAAALDAGEDFQRSAGYWRARAATLPPAPQLPLARSPAALAGPRFSRRSATLPAASWQRLQERARRVSLSPPAVLLASFAEVLATWSRSRSFTLNLPVANRLPLHPEVGEIVGDFTTLCLLEVDFRAEAPFAARVRALQDRLWEDLDHRHFHGVEVLREVARAQGRTGEGMPVVFTSTLGLEGEDASTALARLGEVVHRLTQTPQVWLDLLVSELADGLHLDWDAVDALFPPGLLDDMVAAQLRLLTALAEGEEAWDCPRWPLLPEEQRRRREEVNATAAPIPPSTLHALFVEQARRHPGRLALVAGEERLTYGELLARAGRLCGRLRAAGVRPGALVAVVMEKGWEQAVALLAVLGAGGAYLPLDPELPAERLAALLAAGEAGLAVTQPALAARLAWPAGLARIVVEEDAEAGETSDPLAAGDPDDLAYVMFTSGSTGAPKGVMVRHRGLVNAILDTNRRFAVGPDDRVLALTALHHDMSVYDLFGLLAAGGTVVVPEPWARRDPRRWAALAGREGVTVWNSVPTLLQMLVEQLEGGGGPVPRSLRLAFTGGDWIPLDLPGRTRALLPGLAFVSVGGPTETSLWNISYPVEAVDPGWKSIPYGRPIANTRYYVLGEALEDRPDWVRGELYAAGVGLAAGYFRDEERTRAAFPRHPRTGERLYRTGDLGRYLPSGDIEILGREDLQVKLQGQRIELGEIEAVLARHPAVRAGVVVAAGERGHQRLVAFAVLAGNGGLDAAERIDFKLAQHALRRDLLAGGRVELPGELPRAAAYAGRRSFRRFLPEEVPLEDLGRLLACLAPVEIAGLPVAKRRYPSAGGLYAVDIYLHVRPGRVGGLAGGTYAYDPREHALIPVRQDCDLDRCIHVAINREAFDGCAFSIFLAGRLAGVAATYGQSAQEFCWIEAGAIGQLLMAEAPRYRIGLCPVGKLDPDPVRELLALDGEQILFHSFLGGGAVHDPAASALLDGLAESAVAPGGVNPRAEELRVFLADRLPRHMVPAEIVPVERLPLNANGKVDRRALAERAGSGPQAAGSPRPRTELEQTIADVWREVLGSGEVDCDRAFFELGGNSLHLVQVALRLGRRLGRELTIGELFRHPTVSALAEHLGESGVSTLPLAAIAERAGRSRQAGQRSGRPRVGHG